MKRTVYQVYPSSFFDSKSTGRGDINGVRAKLSYIKSLGVDYIWLTPVFKSLFRDNGYDVVDYFNVDERFGTNEDLKALIDEAKALDIGVMLDMVFNHTSIASTWFQKWLKHDPEYADFYFSLKSQGKPPTNWVSKFGGPAWREFRPGEWYLHLFDETQADLNWANPKVRTALKTVLEHYIALGVSGFRFDVINLIAKGDFVDDDQGDGRRFYTDNPRAHDYIAELSQVFAKANGKFLTVGELSSTTISNAIQYANSSRSELDSVFTFHHLKIDYEGLDKFIAKSPDIRALHQILAKWSTALSDAGATPANFFNNHDQPRSVSRFAPAKFRVEAAKLLFALTHSLPGITYIFQGEEIAMTNPDFSAPTDYRDVETINYFKAHQLTTATLGIKQKSRDNSRTPMQWSDGENGGFSAHEPWIKLAPNYGKINVAAAELDANSVLHFYRAFIEFGKKHAIFELGNIKWSAYENNQVLIFERAYNGATWRFVFSFNSHNLNFAYNTSKVLYSNYALPLLVEGQLQPWQFIIEDVSSERA